MVGRSCGRLTRQLRTKSWARSLIAPACGARVRVGADDWPPVTHVIGILPASPGGLSPFAEARLIRNTHLKSRLGALDRRYCGRRDVDAGVGGHLVNRRRERRAAGGAATAEAGFGGFL